MAEYKSAYTGQQIDAAIGAVANKQDTLVSGTNIKTINNNSILGSGNLVISGGGGSNEKIVDAQDPTQWDDDNNKPTDAVIADIATGSYLAVGLGNIPVMPEEAPDFVVGGTYILATQYDSSEFNTHARFYVKFDEGDEDESEPPYMEVVHFIAQPSDDDDPTSEIEYVFGINQFPISGSGGGVYFEEANMVSESRVTIDLDAIQQAIQDGKEIIIKTNSYNNEQPKYFRIATLQNGSSNRPIFVSNFPDNSWYMEFDEEDDGTYYFNIYQGARRFQPDAIDLSQSTISLDVDVYSYIHSQKPDSIQLNMDENDGENWITFDKAYYDDTQYVEAVYYVSRPVPTISQGAASFTLYTLNVHMNGGNIETDLYITNLGAAQV